MHRNVMGSCLVGLALAGGCRSATDPRANPWHPNAITNIRLPASAAATDTVIVRFTYVAPACDDVSSVEARQSPDVLLFTASTSNASGPCAAGASTLAHEVEYTVFPAHPVPLRIAFTRPGATDSVRVIPQ
jgi:hypothetical protein